MRALMEMALSSWREVMDQEAEAATTDLTIIEEAEEVVVECLRCLNMGSRTGTGWKMKLMERRDRPEEIRDTKTEDI